MFKWFWTIFSLGAPVQSSFIIWTLLRSSFTACNPELAILSSLKLLLFISCSLDGDLFLVPSTISILDSRLSITVSCSCKVSATGPVLRPLQENCLVEEEWNGDFGALPVWCSVYHCQTAQRNARKTPPVLEKKEKKPGRCNLVTYSWCSASGSFSLLPVVGKVHAHIIAL